MKAILPPLFRCLSAALPLLMAVSCAHVVPDPEEPVVGPQPPGAVAPPAASAVTPKPMATAPRGGPAPATPALPPLTLTLQDAILMALAGNQALAVQKITPQIRRLDEEQVRATFDPHLTGQLSGDHARTDDGATNDGVLAQTAVQKFFPTGTTVAVGAAAVSHAYGGNSTSPDTHPVSANLSVTQALLRGAGQEVNLARLRQARFDTLSSDFELRGFAQTLLSDTEKSYWDYVLAQRQTEIYQRSLELAEKQRNETAERIRLGKLAGSELAAADAELALRREDLINAQSSRDKQRISLLRLLNPGGTDMWRHDICTTTLPAVTEIPLEPVETHVALALKMRPDLNQARLAIQRNELELIKTKNGLLPKLDLFMTLGGSQYADSFGRATRAFESDNYSAAVGLSFDWPVFNRAAIATHNTTRLTQRQVDESLANLALLAQQDVYNAHLEVQRANAQIRATEATRKAQEEKLRGEMKKFRLGKSTSLQVGQAQRDLLSSQIAEVEATLAYMKAFVDLYRLDGTLLETRGIQAPGATPVILEPRPPAPAAVRAPAGR
ncbi:MAG: TolC family protein [Lentisphaeria bacterium]